MMDLNAFDFIRNNLNRIADGIASSDGSYPVWDYRSLMELIDTLESEYRKKEAPASVQPEIIRCKDCRYSSPNGKRGCLLERFDSLTKTAYMCGHDYCSRAERREE